MARNGSFRPRHFRRVLASEDSDVLAGIEKPVVAAHQGLGQIHRIFNHCDHRQVVAMPRPVLREDGFVAARNAVAAHVIGLQMGGGDGEHVAFPHAGGKALPGVRRVVGRMRASVHPDGALAIPSQHVGVEGDQLFWNSGRFPARFAGCRGRAWSNRRHAGGIDTPGTTEMRSAS